MHNPPLGSILKAVEIPPYGGDTAWTNLVAAYDGLSRPIKELVDGLHAVHRNEILVELGSPQGLALRSAFTSSSYWTEHPVVRVHPETGEKALFVNPNFTSHVVGLTNKESRALLAFLYDHVANPRYTVRFRWAPGSIAFWDNRATAHLAALDAVPGEPRTLHRITVARRRAGRPRRLPLRGPRRRCVPVTVVENRLRPAGGDELKLVDLRTADEFVADEKPRRRFPRGLERLLGVVVLLGLWQLAASRRVDLAEGARRPRRRGVHVPGPRHRRHPRQRRLGVAPAGA